VLQASLPAKAGGLASFFAGVIGAFSCAKALIPRRMTAVAVISDRAKFAKLQGLCFVVFIADIPS
jgi:hypothetical protein